MHNNYRLAKMTWQEMQERIEECDIVFVPVGSTEQHGPALPLDNDHFIATRFGELVCEALWPDLKVTLAPTLAFGHSPHHMDFIGTITIDEIELAEVYIDLAMSLAHHGFSKIIFINGHGGNKAALTIALNKLRRIATSKVFSIDWWSMIMDKIPEMFSSPVCHGCDMETSVAWALGQRVLEDKRVDEPGKSPYPGFVTADMRASPPQVSTGTSMKDFTDSGVVGYSTKATKEKGEVAVQLVVQRMVEFVRSLRREKE
ncbi:MAG: creatininase family protein [Candidatus Thorarchaeota archaeon]|jgi:creatinine amidohydrolase